MSAIDTPSPTGTSADAARSRGRSRPSTVPLVSTENGVPERASASTMPGMSR